MPSIATIQDQKGITLLLRQLQWNKEVAKDLKIVISHAQLDSGLTEPILMDTKTKVNYIEEGHIAHIRERLGELGGCIAIEELWCPELQHKGDISIMKTLSNLQGIKQSQLKKANLCRKWLKVITIAELASIDSCTIPPNRFNGTLRAKSTLEWHRQPPPTQAMWTIFRQMIKRAFCTKHKNVSTKLATPLDRQLGKW